MVKGKKNNMKFVKQNFIPTNDKIELMPSTKTLRANTVSLPSQFEMNLSSPATPSDTLSIITLFTGRGKKSTFDLSPSRNK